MASGGPRRAASLQVTRSDGGVRRPRDAAEAALDTARSRVTAGVTRPVT